MKQRVAQVVVSLSNKMVDRFYSYLIPEDMNVEIGDTLTVPFGHKDLSGFCIGFDEMNDQDPYFNKLREIIAIKKGDYILSKECLNLMHYMHNELKIRYIDAISLFYPRRIREGYFKDKTEKYIVKSFDDLNSALANLNKKLNDDTMRLLEYIYSLPTSSRKSDIVKNFSLSRLNTLIKYNLVYELESVVKRESKFLDVEDKHIILNNEQQKAYDTILNNREKIYLLKGVTGSGKTEVYLHVIEKIINEGKNAIVLVPEIALTSLAAGIFKQRFGDKVAILHSSLSDGEKYDAWKAIAKGEIRIVVGTRSAIFAPIDNIGVIVIDEEHDGSYQSDNNPRYRTVDIAIKRCLFYNAPLILASATPSLDSYYKAKMGEYVLISMNKRTANAVLPDVKMIDLHFNKPKVGTALSDYALLKLQECIDRGDQAIIFLNRRAYSKKIICSKCGYIPECVHCSSSLMYFKKISHLKCRYCLSTYQMMDICPKCGAEHSFKSAYLGTENIEIFLEENIKNAKVIRMDRDTVSVKDGHYAILNKFNNREANILIGTQMVAKGHDFHNVTLVIVVDADGSLMYSGYLANEETFQLITQVAGRAGRGEKKGEVVIQTYNPRSFVLEAALEQNYEKFYEKEIRKRAATKLPPFATFVRLYLRFSDEFIAHDITNDIYKSIKNTASEYILKSDVRESAVFKVRNIFRYECEWKVENEKAYDFVDYLSKIIDAKNYPKSKVDFFISINPK